MPFSFGAVCDLLQSLESNHKRTRRQKPAKKIVDEWFAEHGEDLESAHVDKVALLSTLLPERRTDRIFNIKEKRLEQIVVKACLLGTRKDKLRHWQEPGSGRDLAECIEAILKEAPNGRGEDFTVEEIDDTLHQLAAAVPFSSPAVRSSRRPFHSAALNDSHPLERFFSQMNPRDVKWLCRLILKSFLPVIVPETMLYYRCHRLLPTVMKIHDNFAVALDLLNGPLRHSQERDIDLEQADLPRLIKPKVGVKVGRQTWLKARSIRHCLDMGRGLMSCETKVDGEYVQIHIDLSKGRDCIQIFSKSGKDSTADRREWHGAVRRSLGLGDPTSCQFEKQCILEGEMVVWHEIEKRVLGFEKIRKYVNRSGRFIGTDQDSQRHSFEKLMIVYFDVLLIDDDSMLNTRHSARRRRLETLIHRREGIADLVNSKIINFSSLRIATRELREAFAASIQHKEEGLVLKPDEPYFNFGNARRQYASCCLKLKKGYVKNLGDVGDFAVVGARYDPTRAKAMGLPNTKYTHFYLGCPTNKDSVLRFDVRPIFKVVNEVELNAQMTQYFWRSCWEGAVSPEENDVFDLDLPEGIMKGKKMAAVFKELPVFDVTGFSFHKESMTNFWSFRFPYVCKIHTDRSWKDCLSFDELQKLAETHRTFPDYEDRKKTAQWIEALEKADPKRSREAVMSQSQTTNTTETTASVLETPSQRNDVHSPVKSDSVRVRAVSSSSTSIPTPPTSSAVQPPEQSSAKDVESTERSPARKRRRIASPNSPRRSEHVIEVVDLTTPSASSTPSQRGVRQPLDDISSAPSSQGNVLPPPQPQISRLGTFHKERNMATSSPLPPRLPVAVSFNCQAAEVSSSFKSPSKTCPASALTNSATLLSPTCLHAGATCALANFLVLLSPCVASMPLLTEDLLPNHGIAAVFSDIPSWLATASLQTTVTRKQPRVVLVERRRAEATKEFLGRLQAEPLKGRHGRPEVVIVYDWRILEAITDEEKALRRSDGTGTRQKSGTGAHAKALWSKYYVGLC